MSNDDPLRHISCRTHCCLVHGCKYSHEDCPVELGLQEQAYPCEECRSPNSIDEEIMLLREEQRNMTLIYTRLGRMGE